MLINNRFEIDRLRGEVTDRQTGMLNRVEPRLIKLLCLLAEHRGKPVFRKMIVEEIWNNYPGGDEGLNQAISVLRKLLKDSEKRTIETLPKIGYCFHGIIGPDQIVLKRKSLKVIYTSTASFLLLIIALVFGYYNYHANDKIVPGKLSHEESAKAFKLDSKEGNQPVGRTDNQESRIEGEADSRRK